MAPLRHRWPLLIARLLAFLKLRPWIGDDTGGLHELQIGTLSYILEHAAPQSSLGRRARKATSAPCLGTAQTTLAT